MKKYLFALALFISVSSVSLVASDLSDAKRSLKSAQKELSSVTSKRDKAQKKQNELQADYDETLAKMAANQDKPKSLAYKDAVKKSESLPIKLEQNAQLLASLNRQVDSLQKVVNGCESALSQIQEAEAAEEVAESKSEEEEPVVAEITDPVLLPVEKEDRSDIIEFKEDVNTEATTGGETSSSKPTTFLGKVWRVIKIIFWIIVGLIALVIFMKIGNKGASYGSSKEGKQKQIAEKQKEIARLQQQIASARSWEHQRGSKQTKLDINQYKEQIARIRAEIARIKAS